MAVATLNVVVLDCPDPAALARFYADVLGGTVEADGDDWVDLKGHGGTQLAFQRAPGHTPPAWPRPDGGQQFHLDLTVEDLRASHDKVLALGARLLDDGGGDRTWRVYADPAGHPFCLCAC
ncbi:MULTISPECIES: VOC family protein [Streptomyces]|uniref:VOC family protein n=1 Tax=Streptomyces lycii TaxID=2654337 RepID=A0ABQ7F880_9ACTN|nr:MULTISPECIES: VOC family protein [Streptomyces]KAF4405039.1 VOC family protein [Streptomyces lycii]PGH47712.1 glyoxalase [Streptomyces sp. Ru87]